MRQFRFLRSVKVAGVMYHVGDVADEDEISPGSLESCLRVGHCVPYNGPPPVPPDLAETQGEGSPGEAIPSEALADEPRRSRKKK